MEQVEVETERHDDESEDAQQYVRSTQKQIRPEVRVAYADLMNFVDQADARIFTCLSRGKKMFWSQAYVTWIITMLLCVNAQRLYQSATGDFFRTQSDWNNSIIKELTGRTQLDSLHPKSVCPPQQWGYHSKAALCRCCWYFEKKDTRTVRHCSACNTYICKHCDDSDKHSKFANRDPTQTDVRHTL